LRSRESGNIAARRNKNGGSGELAMLTYPDSDNNKRTGWRHWLLIALLFVPIPFIPWWLGIFLWIGIALLMLSDLK
jgi:hypothetical protein